MDEVSKETIFSFLGSSLIAVFYWKWIKFLFQDQTPQNMDKVRLETNFTFLGSCLIEVLYWKWIKFYFSGSMGYWFSFFTLLLKFSPAKKIEYDMEREKYLRACLIQYNSYMKYMILNKYVYDKQDEFNCFLCRWNKVNKIAFLCITI